MKYKIVKNPKGGFDLVAGDKIVGHHDTEEAANAALEAITGGGDDDDATLNAKINAAINGALTAREKRFNESLAKTLPEAIKAVLTPTLEEFKKTLAPGGEDPPGKKNEQGTAPKPDPELIKLRERFEASEKRSADAEARAKAVEDKARKDAARAEIITALDAKGIKGERAKALVSHMEASGSLRFTDDGKPELTVKRSRSKGGTAEELAFDLAAGIEDWTKTDAAKEWLPAPGTQNPANARGTQNANGVRRAAQTYEKPATTEAEMERRAIASLEAKGVDVIDAYRR
jgi:hypothetical protein